MEIFSSAFPLFFKDYKTHSFSYLNTDVYFKRVASSFMLGSILFNFLLKSWLIYSKIIATNLLTKELTAAAHVLQSSSYELRILVSVKAKCKQAKADTEWVMIPELTYVTWAER